MATHTFQITDIASDDLVVKGTPYGKDIKKEFVITLYGIDDDNDRVICHVRKFNPYFFVKVPNEWLEEKAIRFAKHICKDHRKEIRGYEAKPMKEFYGFHWSGERVAIQEYQFVKIEFRTHGGMKDCAQCFKDYHGEKHLSEVQLAKALKVRKAKTGYEYEPEYKDWFDTAVMKTTAKNDSNLYESSIHPIIRFIHESGIDPTGWVTVANCNENKPCTCRDSEPIFGSTIEFACRSMKDITKLDKTELSQYVVASFDIECDSSHGDFPQTKKNFKKLATDIFDSVRILFETPEGHRILEDVQSYLYDLIRMGFNPDVSVVGNALVRSNLNSGRIEIHQVFIANNLMPSEASLTKVCEEIIKEEFVYSNFFMDTKPTGTVRDKCIQRIKVIVVEYLRTSDNREVTELGDPIIQIGTVCHKYGLGKDEMVRHIVVIGPEDNMADEDICDTLEEYNIEVKRCKTESELLMEWVNQMNKMDPDFITGYNIFGFDFKYLYERAEICFCNNYRAGRKPCRKFRGQTYHPGNCQMRKFLNMGKIDSNNYQSRHHRSKICKYVQKELNSSALGDNSLYYFHMDGRIIFDIQKEVQKGHQLESYKLDNVASHFMRGTLKDIRGSVIVTDSKTLKAGDYISFRKHSNIGEELHEVGRKYHITTIVNKEITLAESLDIDLDQYHRVEWCLNKDDVTPQDIFDKHKMRGVEGATARAEVAKYCIQDCELCIDLLLLLDIIPNNLAMANVSHIPASYIFLRGQGVRVTSVVAKTCNELNTRMPDLKKSPLMRDYVKMMKAGVSSEEQGIRTTIIQQEEAHHELMKPVDGSLMEEWVTNKNKCLKDKRDEIQGQTKDELIRVLVTRRMTFDSSFGDPKEWELDEWYDEAHAIFKGLKGMEGYEGAIVLEPTPGIYLDDPIAVMDYASLYPSSIIEKNCSHETQIEDMSLIETFTENEDYYKVTYENWVYRLKGKGNTVDKVIHETEKEKTCYFLTHKFMEKHGLGSKGIIPKVLEHLLQARKATKKRMKAEPDEFKYKVLDGLQLAYKVTANSVYGQLGARTSTVYKMNLAACTTSSGRSRINDASRGVVSWAEDAGREAPEVIYGDTDSIFVKFSRQRDGQLLAGKEALQDSIDCGIAAGDYITKMIHREQGHAQQVLEYEKTFWPFILISKKRYTGDKYELNTEDCKRTSMGIVLKRRDNAPIVKYVFGNVIEIIMMEKDFSKAKAWLVDTLQKIRLGEFDLSKFIITKSLRGYYKNPKQIAHKVLADRMTERDPGNKPRSNDRIPYAYIKLDEKLTKDSTNPYKSGPREGDARDIHVMQGDRIEHVDYIRSEKKELDYNFYITNQIMNPVKQVLDLHMDPKETAGLFGPR